MRKKRSNKDKHFFIIGIALGIGILLWLLFQAIFFLQIHYGQKIFLTNRPYIIFTASIQPNKTMSDIGFVILSQKGAIYMPIAPDSYVQTDGENKVHIGSLYALQSVNAPYLLHDFFRIITQNTNTYIDGYIFIKGQSIQTAIQRVNASQSFLQSFSLHDFMARIQTNLSDADLVQIPLLSKEDFSSSYINQGALDAGIISQDISEVYTQTVISEQPRISIYNGSGTAGKAEFLSQLLMQRGYVIDNIGTIPSVSHSSIFAPSVSQFPITMSLLEEMISTSIQKSAYSPTADISIVIGKDFSLYHF